MGDSQRVHYDELIRSAREAFDSGQARGPMMQSYFAHRDDVQGSPHFFLADGTDVANPGIELHQEGEGGTEVPVVDDDEPGVYDGLVRHAAIAAGVA